MSLFQSVVTVPSRSMKSLAPFSSQIPRATKRDSNARDLALLHPQGWSDPRHWRLETGLSDISASLHTPSKHGWVYSTEEERSEHLLTTETVHLRSKGLGAQLQLEFIVLWSECEDVAKTVEPDFIHDGTVDADFHVSAHVRGRDQSPIHCHLLQQEKGHQQFSRIRSRRASLLLLTEATGVPVLTELSPRLMFVRSSCKQRGFGELRSLDHYDNTVQAAQTAITLCTDHYNNTVWTAQTAIPLCGSMNHYCTVRQHGPLLHCAAVWTAITLCGGMDCYITLHRPL